MTTIRLAADYSFPSTYSCRIPMSSISSAPVMPAPGPATVRLALIRVGIEYLGHNTVREEIFPALSTLPIRIRPPQRVGISAHRLRAYKWEKSQSKRGRMQEAVAVREMAHASGTMTIYLKIPSLQEAWYRLLLGNIGYWGQTDSLTCCVRITQQAPEPGEYAQPLGILGSNRPLQSYFSCVTSEFSDPSPSWEEITSSYISRKRAAPLQLDIYVWPLMIARQSSDGKLLLHSSLEP